MDYFNIHNFFQIRTAGWIGLGIVAVLAVIAAVKAFARVADERRTEKAAIRAENARLNAEKEAAKEAAKAEKEAASEPPIHQAVQDAEALTAQMDSALHPAGEAPAAPDAGLTLTPDLGPAPDAAPEQPQE